jgi:hypothetical protein
MARFHLTGIRVFAKAGIQTWLISPEQEVDLTRRLVTTNVTYVTCYNLTLST